MKIPFMKQVAVCLAVTVFMLGLAQGANAGLVTSAVTLAGTDREADLATVRQAVELKMVKTRLLDYGFTTEEITERLALLSDEELHQLALRADEVHVGGDGAVILILVIALAVVVWLLVSEKKVVVTDR
ncbi:MAG: PA2779 family protein [Planctomycetota bacterium]|jgi:hypothetical protein